MKGEYIVAHARSVLPQKKLTWSKYAYYSLPGVRKQRRVFSREMK